MLRLGWFQFIRVCFVFLFLSTLNCVYADAALLQRNNVQLFIEDMVSHHHFDKNELINDLSEARLQPQIIQSMDKPYEKKTWDVYKALFLTPARLQAGLDFWRANQNELERAQKQFGVPAEVIVAIIGVETLYGKNQGNYRVLDALTTLAFDYPKRSEYFTKELKEYLLLCREHGVPVTYYKGSYAGAMGKPQFMPSSYRFYAVNFEGRGRVDLMNDDKDVISSVANYFHRHGWAMNEMVAQPATVRGVRYRHLTKNNKFPDYSFKHLLATGIRPSIMLANHPAKAGIIELMTHQGEEYWVAYPNFYVITHYNTSPQYALVVHLLSQQLGSQWASLQTGRRFHA